MTDALVTRLRERITQTETWARDALHRPWLAEDNFLLDQDGGEIARFEIKADARHAALNEPRAVLRRCAADLRRLERHAPAEPGIGHFGSSRFKGTDTRICAQCSHDGDWGATVWPCPDVVDLAASYGLKVTE